MQGSTSQCQHVSPSEHTDSGRILRVRTKMNEVSRHIDISHKQVCMDLEKATQCITLALQHEVGRNQELCMLIRRLEEKEAETGRSLTEQVESNKQLKLKIDELYKHLEEKDHSLTQANQTVAYLKNELRDLHQHLQSQPSDRTAQEVDEWPEGGGSHIKPISSPSSPLQSDQLTAAEEPLVWSEQLESPDDHIPLVTSDGQIPLVSKRGKKIKEENAAHGYEECSQSADPKVEYTAPSAADIKVEQIQTPLVSSDGQRLLEAPVSEDEDGDDDEYGEYSHSERADPKVEYIVPSAADIKVDQIKMRLSSMERTARFRAKIRADPAARAASLAKRRERYRWRKQAGHGEYQAITELPASEAAKRRQQWRLCQRRRRERQKRPVEAVVNLTPLADSTGGDMVNLW